MKTIDVVENSKYDTILLVKLIVLISEVYIKLKQMKIRQKKICHNSD